MSGSPLSPVPDSPNANQPLPVQTNHNGQSTVALSSTEAEYVALAESAREACWLRNLYEELGYTQPQATIIKEIGRAHV